MRFSRIAMSCDRALIVSQVMTQRRVDVLWCAHGRGAAARSTLARAATLEAMQGFHDGNIEMMIY